MSRNLSASQALEKNKQIEPCYQQGLLMWQTFSGLCKKQNFLPLLPIVSPNLSASKTLKKPKLTLLSAGTPNAIKPFIM